ncbi:MAG TPA: cell division protein ZipA C-terminal FtsZ-binding domain-containing protein [Casimicrobiaceae bacterium]
MSALHILLIAAGIALVVAVLVYNRVVEARWRRGTRGVSARADPAPDAARSVERIEPTLNIPREPATANTTDPAVETERAAPLERSVRAERSASMEHSAPIEHTEPPAAATAPAVETGPDADIECIVRLEPVSPIAAGALAAGLHARIGKPLRWFGRADGAGAWERLTSDSSGRYADVVACMLLADRNGPASPAQIEAFAHLVGELAPSLPAAFVPPDVVREAQRAEALDRLCADLDVQIGLTVQKPDSETIQGTRLRGVAEASGFHLAAAGRFEYVHEDTGAVLYTLQSLKSEPFTADSLRATAMPGAVLVLDVARVADPPRVFDQMKISAKRLAATLGATVVDDNRRPLDDAAFAKVRAQVVAASEALAAVHIEPGSVRALALFGA